MKIGIAITSHNRPEVCRETYNLLNCLRPENSIIGIVDDCSCSPPFGFRCDYVNQFIFDKHVGVGVAKNKCLELLHDAGCTHFFLFDDDCRPVHDEWWLPYVNSTLEHACWTFDRLLIYEDYKNYRSFEKPNGCMLYFTRKAVDTIGGWDLDFKGFGYEHCNVSDRAFNAGLTPKRYVDAWHPEHPFELAKCETSFSHSVRASTIPLNLHLYQQKFYSKEFKPFK